ncbi:MAG: asparagine synthase (glutamine-hydrolyzing) [Bacteroidetes bacterium]|nr:asparagine synthase (glutamine-hydrolyzing) [Bacteroidota bacterium]
MCGVVGYISNNSLNIEAGIQSILHRGPDFQNYHELTAADHHVVLGHVRLSILDLDPRSNQPFFSEDERYILTFNGEIYNFLQLKEILSAKGHNFRTSSDTEVLLKYFIEFGTEGFKDFQGMFAFVIYDTVEQKLWLCRDKLGIKPLYYYYWDGQLIWASELKAIWKVLGKKPEIDPKVWTDFLSAGFLYEPRTGFNHTHKVAPGNWIGFDLKNEISNPSITEYWTAQAVKRTTSWDEVLDKSISNHLLSDVPVGLFFSGGVDSSLILSSMETETTTMILSENQEEVKESGFTSDLDYGRKIAKELKVDLIELPPAVEEDSPEAFLNSVEEVARLVEEPIADFTFSVSKHISIEARKRGCTVMLSGMGADEIFAGYPRYQLLLVTKLGRFVWPLAKPLMKRSKFFSKKLERFSNFFRENSFSKSYQALLTPFSNAEIEALTSNGEDLKRYQNDVKAIHAPYRHFSSVKKAMLVDVQGFLSHNFMVADKSSMQASIELRVPLATPELLENTLAEPDSRLITLKRRKIPLYDVLVSRIPKELVDRRKAGFHPPLDKKIGNLGPERIMKYFYNKGLTERLNREKLQDIINDHFANKANNTFKIYRLLFLSAWYAENK